MFFYEENTSNLKLYNIELMKLILLNLKKIFNLEFFTCAKETGLLMAFKCRTENNKLNECLKKWYENEELKEECTQEYLRERSEYRRTGIAVKKWHRGKRINPQTESP